jgi:hypothetical protein
MIDLSDLFWYLVIVFAAVCWISEWIDEIRGGQG